MRGYCIRVCLLLSLVSSCFAQTVREVFAFSNANSSAGPGNVTLVQGRDGKLYGTAAGYGRTVNTSGAVFKVTIGGTYTALHAFDAADGSNPQGGITLAQDGNYYGTAALGGTAGVGNLFKVTPAGVYTTLHEFVGGNDGAYPSAPPIQSSDGNLYGTTGGDGTVNNGTVYKYSPSANVLATIMSLSQDGSQGNGPVDSLLQAADGTLYGMASTGGANGCGTIFHLTTTGKLLNVYSFACGNGGNRPLSALIQASDGSFYGTTALGGNSTSNGDCAFGCGTIFRLSHGVISILYRFSGYPQDGGLPIAGLVEATDGQLYGTTHEGGTNDFGTVYRISTSGQYQLLYSFADRIGRYPDGTLMQDTSGVFYSTATGGGKYLEGSLYNLNMGLSPFIALVRNTGRVGQPVQIVGQGLTGSSGVTINGVAATNFKVVSDTYMTAIIPSGATTGPVVVTTSTKTLTSNHSLRIVQ